MRRTPRNQLAALLRNSRSPGSFATRRTAPLGDLEIEVRGIGQLGLPVSAARAKELRLIARPAKFGHGQDTILDRRIRDAWEIPRSRVKIDKRRWNRTFDPMLDTLRDDLGLPATVRFRADLHSMLAYEPGQFFTAHQDSEKSDEMVGSLVVMLPSNSTGGELVIEHRGESVRFPGSATVLTFVAFYSDTRHEVLPIESGYRIALTYNLLLGDEAASARGPGAAGVDEELASEAATLLEQHFSETPEPRWSGDRKTLEPPDRLVFLLDHQYTERGLDWARLKGDDEVRTAVLRRAAELAECDLGLAHAEVHETWDCFDPTPPWERDRRHWSYDDDNERNDEPDLGELIESVVTVSPVSGNAVRFAADVTEDEVAASTDSLELTPVDTEYTGFMGNYGNTMDRWYQRAAVGLWPRSRAFALVANADPVAAIHQVLDVSGDADRSSELMASLLRFWPDNVRGGDQRSLLPLALRLAWELEDVEHATGLLEPFAIEALAPTDAPMLIALAERYGIEWLDERVAAWCTAHRAPIGSVTASRSEWLAALPDLCANLCADHHAGAVYDREAPGPTCARHVIGHLWASLRDSLVQTTRLARPSQRREMLGGLATRLLSILRATTIADAGDLRGTIVDFVTERTGELVSALVAIVESAAPLGPDELASSGVTEITRRLAVVLEDELAQPERAPDDWSISTIQDAECCRDCPELVAFLLDPDRQQMVWPLAKPRRQHIHRRIDTAELPVTHQTRREGSPHKLVLTKTARLFQHETERRASTRDRLDDAQRLLERSG